MFTKLNKKGVVPVVMTLGIIGIIAFIIVSVLAVNFFVNVARQEALGEASTDTEKILSASTSGYDYKVVDQSSNTPETTNPTSVKITMVDVKTNTVYTKCDNSLVGSDGIKSCTEVPLKTATKAIALNASEGAAGGGGDNLYFGVYDIDSDGPQGEASESRKLSVWRVTSTGKWKWVNGSNTQLDSVNLVFGVGRGGTSTLSNLLIEVNDSNRVIPMGFIGFNRLDGTNITIGDISITKNNGDIDQLAGSGNDITGVETMSSVTVTCDPANNLKRLPAVDTVCKVSPVLLVHASAVLDYSIQFEMDDDTVNSGAEAITFYPFIDVCPFRSVKTTSVDPIIFGAETDENSPRDVCGRDKSFTITVFDTKS